MHITGLLFGLACILLNPRVTEDFSVDCQKTDVYSLEDCRVQHNY
jgi:hypothetical protein